MSPPSYAIFHQQATSGTWYWAVNFSRRGERHYRRFYEPKYDGSDKALAAAIVWRDQQLATTQVLTLVEFCQKTRSSNTSGVPGVHFSVSKRQPKGLWQAKLKLGGGKYISKSFSVLLYGNDRAYELAVAARSDMLTSIHSGR